jgi:hypothetical protein
MSLMRVGSDEQIRPLTPPLFLSEQGNADDAMPAQVQDPPADDSCQACLYPTSVADQCSVSRVIEAAATLLTRRSTTE